MKRAMCGRLAFVAVSLAFGGTARAQTYVWTNNASGDWTNVVNWAGATNYADGAGHTADFSTANISARRTITLNDAAGDGLITVGALRIGDNDYGYTFTTNAAGTTWRFDDPDGVADLDVVNASATANRSHQIRSPLALADDLLVTHRLAGREPLQFFGGLAEDAPGLNLTKAGPGVVDFLGGSYAHSGDTRILGGALRLRTNGVLTFTAKIDLYPGSSLVVDNGGVNLANRIPDAAAVRAWGGTLAWTNTAAAGTDYAETMGALELKGGAFALLASPAAGGQSGAVAFASCAREGAATARFEAPGLGGASNRIVFAVAPSLAAGVLPWALARVATHGVGADWQLVAHDGDGASLRAYGTGAGEAYADAVADWTAATNARPTADVTYGTVRALNALVLDDGIDVIGSTADANLNFNGAGSAALIVQTGGASLFTNTANFEVFPNFGTNPGLFHLVGNLVLYRGDGSAMIRGTGGFAKSGPGTLTLLTASQATGASAMAGPFLINEGLLDLQYANAAGGSVLELAGGTLALRAAAGTVFRSQNVTATNTALVVSRDGTVFSGRAVAGGTLTHTLGEIFLKDGVTLTLNHTNINTDTTYGLTCRRLVLEGDAALDVRSGPGSGDGQLSVTNVTDYGGNRTLTVSGNGGTILRAELIVRSALALGGDLVLSPAGGAITVKAADGFTNVVGNIRVGNGMLASAIDVIRPLGAGPGEVRFAGGFQGGIGAFGAPASFAFTEGGATGLLAWGSANFEVGTFNMNEDDAGAQVTLRNGLDLNAASGAVTRTIQVDNNTAVIGGPMTNRGAGTASLTKGGGSILWLTGALGWNGDTRVIAGHLRIPHVTNLPPGNLNLNPGNAIGGLETVGTFTRGLGAGANQVRLASTGTGNSRPGFSAYGGDLVVDLGGSGAGTGPQLVWNTTNFDPDVSAANTGALYLNSGVANGNLYFLNPMDLNGEATVAVRRFEVNASIAVLAGALTNSQAGIQPVGLLKRGAGTLVLAANNAYDGGTVVEAGDLVIGGGGASGTLGAGAISNNGAIAFFRSGTLTVAEPIVGTGDVAQIGVGKVELIASNTYSGATVISNGTLVVQGALAGGGPVTLHAGAVLAGTGFIAGAVSADGAVSPGASIGTLSFGSSLTFSGVGGARMEIQPGAAPSHDQVAVSGAVAFAGSLTVTNLGGALTTNDSFALFTAGGFGGWFSGVSLPALGDDLTWDTNKLRATGALDVYAFTFGTQTLAAAKNTPASLPVAALLAQAASSRGTPALASFSATSASNGTVALVGPDLVYTPPTNHVGPDRFTCVLADGQGSIVAPVDVTVTDTGTPSGGAVQGLRFSGGQAVLTYTGTAGAVYILQTATNLMPPPVTWLNLATNVAPPSGAITNSDPTATNRVQYYRTVGE